MDARTTTNEAATFSIAGRDYKVRAAGMLRWSAVAEQYIVDEANRRMHSVAAGIADVAERVQYLAAATEGIPSGLELARAGTKLMAEGGTNEMAVRMLLLGMQADQPDMTLEDVRALYDAEPDGSVLGAVLKHVYQLGKGSTSAARTKSGKR